MPTARGLEPPPKAPSAGRFGAIPDTHGGYHFDPRRSAPSRACAPPFERSLCDQRLVTDHAAGLAGGSYGGAYPPGARESADSRDSDRSALLLRAFPSARGRRLRRELDPGRRMIAGALAA